MTLVERIVEGDAGERRRCPGWNFISTARHQHHEGGVGILGLARGQFSIVVERHGSLVGLEQGVGLRCRGVGEVAGLTAEAVDAGASLVGWIIRVCRAIPAHEL